MGQQKRYRHTSSAASSADLANLHSSASSPLPTSSPPPFSPPRPVNDPCSKKAKFKRQFKTAMSSNEKAEKQMKLWTSSVYAHFCPPSIVEEDGKVTYVFVCKSNKTTATNDATEEAEDSAVLAKLDNDDLGMVDKSDKDAEDGDDLSMAESNATFVEDIATEANDTSALPAMTCANINLGRFAVTILRNLAKQIVNNPTICANLKTACKKSNIVPLLMFRVRELRCYYWDARPFYTSLVYFLHVREWALTCPQSQSHVRRSMRREKGRQREDPSFVWDVATYWNSVVEILRRVLKLHEALNLLVILEYHNRPHSLMKSEWDLVNAKGLQNPEGMGQGYVRVKGRVGGFPGVGETE
ncbi:hypothetical protein BJV77DRAFT_1147171 [Russula vinacea]|nr:hypothetical protein BJV77DRAFT_1147171 [Russula vinacea]